LSAVYLVRHGQAGTRDAYDSLSELGKQQARLLGEHFVAQGIRFVSADVGALSRQQQTVEQISAAYANSDVCFPKISLDPGWNEFDLARVYREISPQLGAEDSEFRREYEAMREQIRISESAHAAIIHRKWQPCDTKIVKAWISGRYPYSGETWKQFRQRVLACHLTLHDAQPDANILVVTSATPIAIWVGLSLDILDGRVMKLAGAMFNASYTILRLRKEKEEDQVQLFTFNAAPHLAADGLRTHR
jgi:broad specificity phosphatase PhoE